MSRRTQNVVLGLLGFLLLARGLELRLPQLDRPYWEDEIHHNFAIITAPCTWKVREAVAAQLQPCLDYVLRRAIWFRLLGHQELALRIPSVAYSLVTVGVALAAAQAFFRRRGLDIAPGLALGFLAAGWVAFNPSEIHLAAEARHYSFVSLLSVVWFSLYFLVERPRPIPLFVVGLAFANSHFFALPLVTATSLLEAVTACRQRRMQAAAFWFTGMAAIPAVTVALNYPAWKLLMEHPPGQTETVGLIEGLTSGLVIWWKFQKYLGGRLLMLVVWLVLLTSSRRRGIPLLLAVGLLAMPAFFAYMRLRSGYAFADRYFTPFFGLGFVAVVQALGWMYDRIKEHSAGVPPVFWRSVFATGTCLLAGVTACDLANLRLPAANFSPYFRAYETLKDERGPLLLIHDRPWGQDLAELYLGHMGRPLAGPCAVRNAYTWYGAPASANQVVEQFLRKHPQGAVVLDRMPNNLRPSIQLSRLKGEASGIEEQLVGLNLPTPLTVEPCGQSPSFLWKVRGMRTVAEIRAIAEAVRFSDVKAVFP